MATYTCGTCGCVYEIMQVGDGRSGPRATDGRLICPWCGTFEDGTVPGED